MLNVTLATGAEISIPTSLSEFSLSAYHDFLSVLRRSGLLVKDDEAEDAGDKELLPFIDSVLEALSFIVKGDLGALPVGSIDDDMLENPSLMGVFSHVIDMVTNYDASRRIVPDVGFFFDYKGDVYGISPERAKSYITGIAYSTVEAIELLESDRLLSQKIAETADPQGALSFEMDLRKLAVLARKDGDVLPLQKDEREAWIDARAKHLQDINADVALDIRFFFIAIWMRLLTEEIQTARLTA